MQEGLSPKDRKDKAALAAVLDAAAALDVAIQNVSKHELNLLTDNRPHQGLVLDATPLEFEPLTLLPEPADEGADAGAAPPVWLALDEVTDPQNLGAIMRCAWFLGAAGATPRFTRWPLLCVCFPWSVHRSVTACLTTVCGGGAGVVVSAKNSAPLSATVSKASAGAMEAMVIHSVGSMPRFLQGQAEAGWAVVGAAVGDDAKDCASYQMQRPTVLVMGAPRPPLPSTQPFNVYCRQVQRRRSISRRHLSAHTELHQHLHCIHLPAASRLMERRHSVPLVLVSEAV